MRSLRPLILSIVALSLAFAMVSTATAGAGNPILSRRGALVPLRILLMPLRFLPFHHRPESKPPEGQLVGTSRSVLAFEVPDTARALYLEIEGVVEFERVDILFADGGRDEVDAFGAVRDNGVFEVKQFDTKRKISHVRVIARSREGKARVGLRLGVQAGTRPSSAVKAEIETSGPVSLRCCRS